MDVVTTFLHGHLDDEVYIKKPPDMNMKGKTMFSVRTTVERVPC